MQNQIVTHSSTLQCWHCILYPIYGAGWWILCLGRGVPGSHGIDDILGERPDEVYAEKASNTDKDDHKVEFEFGIINELGIGNNLANEAA